jgi:hypothetical protein
VSPVYAEGMFFAPFSRPSKPNKRRIVHSVDNALSVRFSNVKGCHDMGESWLEVAAVNKYGDVCSFMARDPNCGQYGYCEIGIYGSN